MKKIVIMMTAIAGLIFSGIADAWGANPGRAASVSATGNGLEQPSLTGKNWYYTKHDYIVFNEDGTNTYMKACTFVHDTEHARILFYQDGSLYDYVNILELTDSTLTIGKDSFTTYTTRPPKQLCEALAIPYRRITVKTGEKVTLATTVSPEDADDKSVTLSDTSDSGIVKVSGNTIEGVSPGVTIVVAKTNDGSGLEAGCEVIVADETYQVSDTAYPMISGVDLGLPSGTQWADMNVGADAPFRMSDGFDGPTDMAPIVGSDWEYPSAADFKELTDNCDVQLNTKEYSDFYWYQMHMNHYLPLTAAVFTSRKTGKSIQLYVYTIEPRAPAYEYVYPYCLDNGETYSLTENVEACALNNPELGIIAPEKEKVLIRLVKRGEPIPDGIRSVDMDGRQDGRVYSLSGQQLTAPRKGVNIIGGRKVLR